MPDGKAIADLDFGAILAADAEEGADYALLVGVAAEGVVEDGEDGLFGVCQKRICLRVGSQRDRTCGCMITFRGAVVGCAPTAAGPKGLARWRNDSVSAILAIEIGSR